MSNRTHILQTARGLAVETGSIPSMDDLARHAGVSKGGLMHHFRSRAALVEGVAVQAIEEMDQALADAAERGAAVETWLRLSASPEEAALYRAMAILLTDPTHATDDLMRRAAEASHRWRQLFAEETGDPVTAAVIQLVGDGLLLNHLSGDPSSSIEAVVQWFRTRASA